MIETTSKELSKRLEIILKRKPPSYFYWASDEDGDYVSDICVDGDTPAYTACELMKVLPEYVSGCGLMMCKGLPWTVWYKSEFDDVMRSKSNRQDYCQSHNDSPAEALGLMVVWLDGEGLL